MPKKNQNNISSYDETVRYKLNTSYLKKVTKSPPKKDMTMNNIADANIRYKLPEVRVTLKSIDQKAKPKPKIKVNFWSGKQTLTRLNKEKTNRRHTVGGDAQNIAEKPKNSMVKVRKRVSFLPSPVFTENHVPMVTVPDDLTINLNEEEANDLEADLNSSFNNECLSPQKKRKKVSPPQISSKCMKHKSSDDEPQRFENDNELEYFSKYVVQKLRRMETNQRIYSENIINTTLMLGLLGKLNGKTKIAES